MRCKNGVMEIVFGHRLRRERERRGGVREGEGKLPVLTVGLGDPC